MARPGQGDGAAARPRGGLRVPLAVKLFLVTAALIVAVVAVALGITLRRSETVAARTVSDAIVSASGLYETLEQNRLRELLLGAETVGRDPNFVAYVERAVGAGTAPVPLEGAAPAEAPLGADPVDVASILDQIQERRAILGSDLVIITDDQGVLLARTDQTSVAGEGAVDLYERQALLREAVDSGEATSGVLITGGRMYHAAVSPLSVGAGGVITGYLVNALAVDDAFANRIAESTRTNVVFLGNAQPGEGETRPAVRSSQAPSPQAFASMPEASRVMASREAIPPRRGTIDDTTWIWAARPLVGGGAPMGTVLVLRSFDEEMAPFREIQRTLLLAGAGALLLTFLVSAWMARRLTRPIANLAAMAESVAGGDYSPRPELNRRDEIGALSRSFGEMISALRDKSEVEHLYQEMSAREAAGELSQPKAVPARQEDGTLLVTDLRGLASSSFEPEQVLGETSAVVKMQAREIERQEGTVLSTSPSRILAAFAGERAVVRAIRAARTIGEELAQRSGATGPLAIGAGIASGEYVVGSLEGESAPAVTGTTALIASLCAAEAPNAHVLVSSESAQAAGTEVTANGTKDELRTRWLPAPLPVLSLPLRALTTTMMRTPPGATAAAMATMRMDDLPAVGEVDLRPGDLFAGRYRIEEPIGRGGMGVVYRARDEQLDEVVALKMLPPGTMGQQEQIDRFKREIRIARRITHRNVLRTYDWGEAAGTYFISMEYVRGYTLAQYLEKTPVPPLRAALVIGRQICRGLEAAHQEGIIHRDIKPQNVLIDQKGEVKLMDFGIARPAEAGGGMTADGMILGTPHYMSPEQVEARPLDPRSDVYAMGVLLYELATGKRPFDSPALTAVLTAHLLQPPQPPIERRPEIGPALNAVLLRCLSKDPSKRYRDAGVLLAELERVEVPISPDPVRVAVTGKTAPVH